jgi:thioredoxin 1
MNHAQSHPSPSTDPVSKPDRGKFHLFWRWFWIVTLVVSLGYAWYSFYVPFNTIVRAVEFTPAQQQAAQSGKPIILFFTGKWCVPCRIMKRTIWADEQVAAVVNAGFIFVTIDVDDPDAAGALKRYRVGATPTTIITDTQGNVAQQVVGKMSKPEFLEMLGKLSPSAASLTP